MGQSAADGAQQRRLPGAVRTDHGDPLASVDIDRDAGQHLRAAQNNVQRVNGKRGHDDMREVVRSTSAKNGAPQNAVTTPIGISAGLAAARPTRSASTRNAPPYNMDSGRITR